MNAVRRKGTPKTASRADLAGQPPQPEGVMSNRFFMAWIRSEVEAQLGVSAPELDKAELFRRLLAKSGPSALVSVGLSLRSVPSNPVLETIVCGPTPSAVLLRWARLERFSHTHHRTRVLHFKQREARQTILVEHFSRDGRKVDETNHFFIWGTLVALFERAGFRGVVARLGEKTGPIFYEGETLSKFETLRCRADRCHFEWTDLGDANLREERSSPVMTADEKMSSAIVSAIQSDLSHRWKLDEVAARLRISTRHMQRSLHDEGTTFTELLQSTRISKSRDLLSSQNCTLTEIAFCLGFSDLAHYSRVARRYLQLAPSEFRELAKPLTT